jgi:hypothetical protein
MTSNDELNNNNNNKNLNQSTSSEKSFLEKFFDRELDSTVNDNHSNESDQTIKNNSSSEKIKVKKNESMEIDEEINDYSENVEEKSQVEEFIDKLFNSKLNTSKSKLSILSKTSGLFAFSKSNKKNNENDEIKDKITKTDSVSSAKEKIDYLENYRFSEDNQASAQILSNYLRIFNLLNSDLYKIYFDRQNLKHECKCLTNGLDCCLLNLYNQIKTKTNDQKVNECCNMCMSSYYDNYSINDNKKNRNDWIEFFKINRDSVDFNLVNNLLEINNTIITDELNRQFLVNLNKNINCSCLSNQNKLNCCIDELYEKLNSNNDGKLPDFVLNNSCCKKCGTIEINDNIFTVNDLKTSIDTDDEMPSSKSKENKHNNHSHYPKINVIHNHSNLSPRKAIIKNASTNKTKPSTPRKSVKFLTIEDPKYGFVPVPIPEWQENLRDPLYSNKFINK